MRNIVNIKGGSCYSTPLFTLLCAGIYIKLPSVTNVTLFL